MYFNLVYSILLLLHLGSDTKAKTRTDVKCESDRMLIAIESSDKLSKLYLDNLKYMPEIDCKPSIYNDNNNALFNLSLVDFSICGITRVTNQITGSRTFYHRIVIEYRNNVNTEKILSVNCTLSSLPSITNINRTKRGILPAGFNEPEYIDNITTVETNAPVPILNVTVKQGSSPVSNELNVKPGTPLSMEIYLDEASTAIYGLLVSYMRVSDTDSQEETIIFNGCSVDQNLFENFNTINGDKLKAKFRAFKFPDTTYVQFTGTVNICLDKCQGVKCGQELIGYGRKKRETNNIINEMPFDPKKVFEVTLSTFLKVDDTHVNV